MPLPVATHHPISNPGFAAGPGPDQPAMYEVDETLEALTSEYKDFRSPARAGRWAYNKRNIRGPRAAKRLRKPNDIKKGKVQRRRRIKMNRRAWARKVWAKSIRLITSRIGKATFEGREAGESSGGGTDDDFRGILMDL